MSEKSKSIKVSESAKDKLKKLKEKRGFSSYSQAVEASTELAMAEDNLNENIESTIENSIEQEMEKWSESKQEK